MLPPGWNVSWYDVVQCVPTRRGHQILYKGYTYVFKSKLQCGAEQWICSFRQKTEKELPEWVSIYFTGIQEKNTMRCNLCDAEIEVEAKSMFLLEHLKETHQDIYDLHVHNPEATVGFRVRLDGEIDRTQPLLLEQVCSGEERLETLVAVESVSQQQDTDVINMQYVMLDTKRKHRRSSGHETRRRSWIWKYFDRLSNIVYRCNLCNVVLSTKGSNTNNLNRHMRSKHSDTFKSETLKEENVLEITGDIDTPYAVKTEEIYASNKDVPETVGQRTRRSWIWSYFDYVTTTQAQCKICKRQINHGGNATGNMNRHLKMIHNKTALEENEYAWLWKVFQRDPNFYTCKICQLKLSKTNSESDVTAITNHLRREHGVISGDQIIIGNECEVEQN